MLTSHSVPNVALVQPAAGPDRMLRAWRGTSGQDPAAICRRLGCGAGSRSSRLSVASATDHAARYAGSEIRLPKFRQPELATISERTGPAHNRLGDSAASEPIGGKAPAAKEREKAGQYGVRAGCEKLRLQISLSRGRTVFKMPLSLGQSFF
jgi:hypothetical protein